METLDALGLLREGAVVQGSADEDLHALPAGTHEGGKGGGPSGDARLHAVDVASLREAADFQKYHASVGRLYFAVATFALEQSGADQWQTLHVPPM